MKRTRNINGQKSIPLENEQAFRYNGQGDGRCRLGFLGRRSTSPGLPLKKLKRQQMRRSTSSERSFRKAKSIPKTLVSWYSDPLREGNGPVVAIWTGRC